MNQEKLFEQMHIRKELWNYNEYERAYDELAEELPGLIEPCGVYKLIPNEMGPSIHRELTGLSHLVCSMVTLGPGISERCTAYFMEKDYLKGLMIDSIADQVLFDLSNDFYQIIKEDVCARKGYGLTVRFAPDDRLIPIHFQKAILEAVDGRRQLAVDITEGYMYNPIKTLGYVYGADQEICTSGVDHDCRLCSNTDCAFRKTEKRPA
ncbi:5-methyltetrahydrofolate--homocysteine methyltransferase [Eubacterium sp. 1001713B170207_170306_E7]|uniref:5-methyltetrahydrofolate--homocysteine methyltransferase n=1 Tax=Eubacterium sp. 1001713B170207_170306_E7 TaxID=2787097 RepID=UPI001FACCC27|nr:5-methyltetrahydrofolate--homocysteine methyltransferase [Eubacterium sp. 1001713B170207_170306_E7]